MVIVEDCTHALSLVDGTIQSGREANGMRRSVSQSLLSALRMITRRRCWTACRSDACPKPIRRPRHCGVQLEHSEFQPNMLSDADGVSHKFNFALRLLGERVAINAHEIQDDPDGG